MASLSPPTRHPRRTGLGAIIACPSSEGSIDRPIEQLEASSELSDPDGDALTITSLHAGTWITCTSGGDEVTVGPFPMEALRAALEEEHFAQRGSGAVRVER